MTKTNLKRSNCRLIVIAIKISAAPTKEKSREPQALNRKAGGQIQAGGQSLITMVDGVQS